MKIGFMSSLVNALLVFIILALVAVVFYMRSAALENLFGGVVNSVQGMTNPSQAYNYTQIPVASGQSQNVSENVSGEVIGIPAINQSQLADYALSLINHDREQYNLSPVTLSNVPSAQQHADSMLYYDYFSHWDIYDLKPYMRYTLLGGNGSVSENIAYQSSKTCLANICKGTINPNKSLQSMEYGMMYNDSVCCNNGHRDNILNPYHNQVSIGIAYNGSTIYFVEDFVNNYIKWADTSPIYGNNGEIYLYGSLYPVYSANFTVSQIYMSYDPPLQNLTTSQLPQGSYSYGGNIAGIVGNSSIYYPALYTIIANNYYVSSKYFTIDFNISNLTKKYGAGEYTAIVLLQDIRNNQTLEGSTYTIFINSSGKQYIPKYA